MSLLRTAPTQWPMVGRDEELAFIRAALAGDRVTALVIAGAAGVGKTRLALAALDEAEGAGCARVWAVATRAAAGIPFGAFAQLLPPLRGAPAGMLRRAASALREAAAGRRLVVAVDDADLLDDASATLLHQLEAGRTAFVVVTVRSGQSVPDPIVALWKDGAGAYLELQPLSHDQFVGLARDVLGGEVEGGTLRRLWSVSDGNPLFLRELIIDGLEHGALAQVDGLWRWRRSPRAGARLAELVDVRVGKLGRDERAPLGLLAFGEPLGAALLEDLAGAEALATLEARGVLQVARDGRRVEIRLAHPLYGQALRARISPLRARALQRQLAEALDATGARRHGDLLRLATWRLESGGTGSAQLFVAAARQAQTSLDGALAERLARAAIDADSGFEARHALARALTRQERFEEAETLFAALVHEVPGDADLRVVAEARARNLLWGLGLAAEAERALVEAERALEDASMRDELIAVRGWMLCFAGRPADALDAVTPLLERAAARPALQARAAMAAANALAMAGRPGAGARLATQHRAAALAQAAQRPLLAAQLETVRLLCLYVSGQLDEGAATARQAYDLALGAGLEEGTAIFASSAGAIAMGRGEILAAIRWLKEAAGLMREFDPVGFLPWTLAFLAQAAGQAGDAETAEGAAAEANARRRPGIRMFDVDLGLGQAWSAAARGELSRARQAAREAADRGKAQGHHGFELLALHDLVRLGDAAAAAPRLSELASTADSALARACAAHAVAAAAADGAALDDSAAQLAATGALLRAAEAAASAAGAHRAAGRDASARSSSARAARLAERCQGARTPGLLAHSALDELTGREREIATLAAGGLTNAEIAARLVLSVRTVENHLQRCFGKLGLSRRQELAELLDI